MHNAWSTFVSIEPKQNTIENVSFIMFSRNRNSWTFWEFKPSAPSEDPIFTWPRSICPPLPSLFFRKDFSLFDRIELYWWGFCASDSDKNVWHTFLEEDAKWSMCDIKCAKKKTQWGSHVPLSLLRGKHVKVSSQISTYVMPDFTRNKEKQQGEKY